MALAGMFNEVNAQKARGDDMNKWSVAARREGLDREASEASKVAAAAAESGAAVEPMAAPKYLTLEMRREQAAAKEAAWAATFGVGGRCLSRDLCEGTVRYIGLVEHDPKPELGRTWMGVQWDDADRGKHDGVVKGKRYFETSDGLASASFVKPRALTLVQEVEVADPDLDDDAPEIGAALDAAAAGPSAIGENARDVAMALFSGQM
jgi:hypothetical protein